MRSRCICSARRTGTAPALAESARLADEFEQIVADDSVQADPLP